MMSVVLSLAVVGSSPLVSRDFKRPALDLVFDLIQLNCRVYPSFFSREVTVSSNTE